MVEVQYCKPDTVREGRSMSTPSRRAISLLGIAVLAFTGCTLRPKLTAATVERSGDTEIVDVTLRAADARSIKRRELYFSIVVFDCNKHDNRLPIQPYVSGQPVSRFSFPVEGEFVTVRGSMPADVLRDFQIPCVFLRGGGYSPGKIQTETVPLKRRTGGDGSQGK
jgi:hypothetical protein